MFEGGRNSIREQAKAWATENKNRKVDLLHEKGFAVELTWQGIKHGIRHSDEMSGRAVPALPDLIARARITGHVGETYTLISGMTVAGEKWAVKITAKKRSQGVLLYDHAVFEKKEPASPGDDRLRNQTTQEVPAGNLTVGDALDSVKGLGAAHQNLLDSGPSLSTGRADLAGFMAGDALRRVKDPLRRVQAMSRIARNFQDLKLVNERLELLAGGKRVGKSLLKEAAMREAMRHEELIGEVWGRHYGILSDEDLTRIKSQPGHQLLADPESHLRGRVMSKAKAIKDHPDMFRIHSAGDYDGVDGVGRSVFGGSLMPDQAAQELFDAGLIKTPTPARG